jgi:ribonuclease PH
MRIECRFRLPTLGNSPAASFLSGSKKAVTPEKIPKKGWVNFEHTSAPFSDNRKDKNQGVERKIDEPKKPAHPCDVQA